MLPDSTVLIRLARILGVKTDYFFRPFSIALSGIEFRKKSTMSVKSGKSVQQMVLDNVERYIEIEEICGLPHNSTPLQDNPVIRTKEDVIALAASIRKEWGLGNDGITDVITLLENKGIKVVEVECDDNFDGLSGKAGDCFVIVLNKTQLWR